MKNVVYRIMYDDIHEYDTGFANFTWKYWCIKHDCLLITCNAPTYRVGVKEVFKSLEKDNVEYNKIFIVDGTALVNRDCPNIFEIVDDRIAAWRDMGDLKSIYDRMQPLQSIGSTLPIKRFDLTRYINYGSIIINSKHSDLIDSIPNFKKGKGSKILDTKYEFEKDLNNKIAKTEINLDIPRSYNLNYIAQYDWFSHNWQDGDDKTPFFIKYAYIWRLDNMNKDEYNDFIGKIDQALRAQYTI